MLKSKKDKNQSQIIELINSIISPLELADDFVNVVEGWQNSFEDDVILESINISAKKYLKKYLKIDILDKSSVYKFLEKIPGIARNKSMPLLFQKFVYIQHICKTKQYEATSQDIDEVLNIVNMKLSESGISHESIINIFDADIIPMTWKTNIYDEWVYNLQGIIKHNWNLKNGSL